MVRSIMIESDLIIHTPTVEVFKEVVSYALETGRKWYGIHNNTRVQIWDRHKEKTCVRISETQINYADREFYVNCNYDILQAEDICPNIRIERTLKEFK